MMKYAKGYYRSLGTRQDAGMIGWSYADYLEDKLEMAQQQIETMIRVLFDIDNLAAVDDDVAQIARDYLERSAHPAYTPYRPTPPDEAPDF